MSKFRKAYVHYPHPGLSFEGQVSLTKQQFKDECDVNNILKRFETTGQLPDMIQSNPRYGDFSDVPTYQEALNTVIHAQAQFDALSSSIRDRFANDPTKFLEFVHDEKNHEELVKMGLANAKIASGGVSTPPEATQPPVTPLNAV